MRSIILSLLLTLSLYGASEGPLSPSDSVGSGCGAPTLSNAADGLDADCGPTGEIHEVGTFGFAIPVGATINGVLVEFEAICRLCEGGEENDINLTGVGTCTGKAYNEGGSPEPPNSTTYDSVYESLGGASDAWSCTSLTETNVNATTFGVIATAGTGVDSAEVQYDHIRVTVFYTEAGSAKRKAMVL
jgi:hypothetical protein